MNILAITAVVASSFTAAYLIIRKEVKHCKSLDSALRLITAIKNKALFYSMPFSEIITDLKDNDDIKNPELFDLFIDRLAQGLSVPEAWKFAVNNADFYLEIYECDTLIRFCRDMCNCSREEISQIAENAVYELTEFKNTAIENRNKRSKSTAAVAISAGIMIVLMFV